MAPPIGNTDCEVVIQDIGQHVLKVCRWLNGENESSGFLTFSFENPGVAQAIGTSFPIELFLCNTKIWSQDISWEPEAFSYFQACPKREY